METPFLLFSPAALQKCMSIMQFSKMNVVPLVNKPFVKKGHFDLRQTVRTGLDILAKLLRGQAPIDSIKKSDGHWGTFTARLPWFLQVGEGKSKKRGMDAKAIVSRALS